MKNRILITGINGFLGSSFEGYLKKKHPRILVAGIDRIENVRRRNVYIDNLNSVGSLKKIISNVNPEYIFHFAGGRVDNEDQLFLSNFMTTKILFDAIAQIKGNSIRVIVPGTAAEYGNSGGRNLRIKETDSARPLSWYGYVKLLQTTSTVYYAHQGHEAVVARIFNIMGRKTPASLSIGRFAQQIALMERNKDNNIIDTMNLNGKRDFLDIDDVCAALMALAHKGKSGEVYNVCSGKSFTIRALLKMLISKSTLKNIKINENKNNHIGSFDCVGSNQKIMRMTDWMPDVDIGTSLENTLNYYRAQVEGGKGYR